MATAFVFSILGVLVIAVVATAGFLSNIHDRMTRAERRAVFGSEDSVPEYKVFPMTISDKKINLKIERNGMEIFLNLTRTAGYLVTKYTPVWLAVSDPDAYNHVRYEPLPTAMNDIGDFELYHDVENEAAITVYTDPVEDTVIEGIVTSNFAIRSLPKRLMGTSLKNGDHVVETFPPRKRSITSDAKEDTGYFVLFTVADAPENAKRILTHLDNLHREKRSTNRNGKRKVPKAVFPEFLIVLDHNAIRDRDITQALRFMLAFFNGVDLVYSALDKPKIHPNIAGIIIAADDSATPYIAENATATKIDYISRKAVEMVDYFYRERVRLPIKWYDMIIAMTTATMCNEMLDPCYEILGSSGVGAACSSHRSISSMQFTDNTAFIHYNWAFDGVDTAIHETAHFFGVKHDEGNGVTANCTAEEGYVMSTSAHYTQQNFKWSNCSRNFFKTYFSSNESKCLDNKPRWLKPVKRILAGRWLPMDGQCRNYGYEKSCKLNQPSICVELSCKDTQSKCIQTRQVPLRGSKCGRKMHCNSKKECVHKR